MARTRSANPAATPTDRSSAVAAPAESLSAIASEANLVALQQHVAVAAAAAAAAASNGAAGAPPPGVASTVSAPTGSIKAGLLYAAASAAQLVAQQEQQSSSRFHPSSAESEIHPDLRFQFAQHQHQQQQQHQHPHSVHYAPPLQYRAPAATMSSVAHQPQPQPQQQPQQQPQPPVTPNGAAPAIDENLTPGSPGSQDESALITDGRRGPRRELSTSKRAAQNRAAQRAFRQRKEGYIKKLEEQVREFGEIENQFKQLQAENFSLREYVIHLQSKIIDLKADMPQPPANLNLNSVGLAHTLSGASAAAAAANLLSNAANAAALQRQQEQEQHAAAAAAAAAASGYAPAAYIPQPPVAADGTAADPKNEASLARVAQAVAQFEHGTTADAVAAAAAAAAANVDKAPDAPSDPMDTTPEGVAEPQQNDTKAE